MEKRRRKRRIEKFDLPFALSPSPKRCFGKVCYADKKTVVTAKNKRLREGFAYLREYYCDKCFSWHLTKQRKKDTEDEGEELDRIGYDSYKESLQREEFENKIYA